MRRCRMLARLAVKQDGRLLAVAPSAVALATGADRIVGVSYTSQC